MQTFPLAHAAGADSEAVLNQCLQRLGRLDADSAGLVFASPEFRCGKPDLLARLREATGIQRWMGGVGLGVCAPSCEYYDQPALALMQVALPAEHIIAIDDQHSFSSLSPTAATDLAGGLGMVFLDAARADASDWLSALSSRLPDSFLIGGMGQSDARNGASVLAGHSGLVLAPGCEVLVDHTQGCSLIGRAHTITRAFRNVVVELDGRPALEVLEAEIGEVLARDLQRALSYIFAALPVSGQDRRDYLVRNIVGVDRQHQLVAIADLPRVGDRFQFARRDGNSARDDMEQMLLRLRRRAGRNTPRGAVYFSCVGRGRNQFGADSAELKMIADALGDIPLLGFFANGEIYHSRTYAYTGVLALFI